jgi:putative acetyltransferase
VLTPERIRPATPADCAAMAAVHRASIAELCAGAYPPEQIAAWTALLIPEVYLPALRSKLVLVAEAGAGPDGLGILDAAAGEIQALYVAPEAAGHGLGGLLLEALERAAWDAGARRVQLRSTLNARDFYARRGYAAAAPDAFELPGGVALACVDLRKDLRRRP